MKGTDTQKNAFMEGIERYKKKGIAVLIDGKDFGAEDYERLLTIQEDGSFYMGDYIGVDTGKLTEIHFDKVYYT